MTVASTPWASIKASSISGVASSLGGTTPVGQGYFGSSFQTWTCGSTILHRGAASLIARLPGPSARRAAAAAAVVFSTSRRDGEGPKCITGSPERCTGSASLGLVIDPGTG